MKKSYIKLLILLIFMTMALLYSAIARNIFENNLTYGVFMFLTFLTSYFLVGFEKEEKLHSFDIFRKVFVYTVIYLMLIYILGFIIGFVRNPYSLEILKLAKNIIPLILIIIFEELLRFNVVKKLEKKGNLIVFATVIFILIDIVRVINLYSFESGMDIYEVVGVLIIPTIFKNALFSYIAYRGYYKVNMLYKFLMTVLVYFLPIYPDLGIYLESILNIMVPTLIYLSVNSLFNNQKLIFNNNIKYSKILLSMPPIMILTVSIILTSGLFKYYAMSVGSGSMYPTIKVGDAVVVEKVDTQSIKKGSILVHKHNGKIILHRVIKVNEKSDETCYYTKGDANQQADNYEICQSDIYGTVVFRVPFVGWPSVLIERLNKK